jgi:hypothetical protein
LGPADGAVANLQRFAKAGGTNDKAKLTRGEDWVILQPVLCRILTNADTLVAPFVGSIVPKRAGEKRVFGWNGRWHGGFNL